MFHTLGVTVDGHWVAGIGDPTLVGWITVGCYFLASVLCTKLAISSKNDKRFWCVLAIGLALLGINKQLDLQTAVTQWARSMAMDQGWYARRRPVQLVFVSIVAIAGFLMAFALLRLGATPLRRNWHVRVGILFLTVFVIVRAASFHHVDLFLGSTLAGLRLNVLMELSGIAWVILGCFAILRQRAAKTMRAADATR